MNKIIVSHLLVISSNLYAEELKLACELTKETWRGDYYSETLNLIKKISGVLHVF